MRFSAVGPALSRRGILFFPPSSHFFLLLLPPPPPPSFASFIPLSLLWLSIRKKSAPLLPSNYLGLAVKELALSSRSLHLAWVRTSGSTCLQAPSNRGSGSTLGGAFRLFFLFSSSFPPLLLFFLFFPFFLPSFIFLHLSSSFPFPSSSSSSSSTWSGGLMGCAFSPTGESVSDGPAVASRAVCIIWVCRARSRLPSPKGGSGCPTLPLPGECWRALAPFFLLRTDHSVGADGSFDSEIFFIPPPPILLLSQGMIYLLPPLCGSKRYLPQIDITPRALYHSCRHLYEGSDSLDTISHG